MRLIVRSVLFNLLFYLNLLVMLVAALPTLVLPRGAILLAMRLWAYSNYWLLRTVCGISFELRGLDRLPPGPVLIAAKHQ